ncbi:TPA: mechanosensitive ion channel family protein [Pseudomonas aeruginosa]|nr:mechanosensitive ion channel family protein [Pseudomonas aeruginosa]
MLQARRNCWGIELLVLLLCIVLSNFATAQDQVGSASRTEDANLDQLNTQLELIRQSVSTTANDGSLSNLRQTALHVQGQANRLSAMRASDIERVDDQLKVLGPTQPDEAQSLSDQRQKLSARKNDLLDDQRAANEVGQSARDLATQILNLRRSLFSSEVTTRSSSPFSPRFWSSLIRPAEDDLRRLNKLYQDIQQTVSSALVAENHGFFISTLVVALLVWVVGRRLLEHLLAWSMIQWVPEGRLRRSALALAIGLATILTFSTATSLAYWGLAHSTSLNADMISLSERLLVLIVFCSFIVGLGRAMLMLSRPSWRLPPIPDPIASAMAPFPVAIALALLIIGTLERINDVAANSLALTVAVNGLTALVVSLICVFSLLRYYRVRHHNKLKQPTGITGLVPITLTVWCGLILLALLSGYLTLAYFLTVKLLWIGVVSITAYLLIAFLHDLCETLLSPKLPGGMKLAASLGLSERHQAQASTLLSGIGGSFLLFTAVLVALTPSDSSPGELLEGLTHLNINNGPLGKLNVAPKDIFLALTMVICAVLGIRIIKRWLSERLLPETNMDAGMRSSLVTLVGYIGYILLVIIVMSTLHINLTHLTWVVSALSVGIGFGLQAIVQNFISGLILLTERPVKVGDWVSLGGVEGDIRRINVRATEIQMSDHSTVIVPNSQFISQNVRNVTMGGALGVVGITLTLPLHTDVLQVRELLLRAYTEHPSIISTPAPSVSFKDLTSDGLILSISGYVNSPRSVSSARSDLLFTILEQLRDVGISLSSPRNMILVSDNQAPLSDKLRSS